jgi:hypothetical protein
MQHHGEPFLTADDDIAAAGAPLLVRIAGGLIASAGILAFLTGMQVFMLGVRIRGAMGYAPWGLMLVGAATAACGAMVFRMRAVGAIGGTVLSCMLFIGTALWLVWSFGHGLFSLFAFGAPIAAVGAVILAALSIGPCQRATEARARLAAEGLNLGI